MNSTDWKQRTERDSTLCTFYALPDSAPFSVCGQPIDRLQLVPIPLFQRLNDLFAVIESHLINALNLILLFLGKLPLHQHQLIQTSCLPARFSSALHFCPPCPPPPCCPSIIRIF